MLCLRTVMSLAICLPIDGWKTARMGVVDPGGPPLLDPFRTGKREQHRLANQLLTKAEH